MKEQIKERIAKTNIFNLKNQIIKKEEKEIKKDFLLPSKKAKNKKEQSEEKINNFIERYSKNGLKIISLPGKKRSPYHKSIDDKKAHYTKIKRMDELIGYKNKIGTLGYINEKNEMYLMTFNRVSICENFITFLCYHKLCRGQCKLTYNNQNLEIKRDHTINYAEHCSSKKKKLYYFIQENLKDNIKIVLILYNFSSGCKINTMFSEPKLYLESKLNNVLPYNKELRIDFDTDLPLSRHLTECSSIFNKYLGQNCFLGHHYVKDNKGKVFLFNYKLFSLNRSEFCFSCASRNCNCKGFYNIITKVFTIDGKHKFNCEKFKFGNSSSISNKIKIVDIIKNHPEMTDFQIILHKIN